MISGTQTIPPAPTGPHQAPPRAGTHPRVAVTTPGEAQALLCDPGQGRASLSFDFLSASTRGMTGTQVCSEDGAWNTPSAALALYSLWDWTVGTGLRDWTVGTVLLCSEKQRDHVDPGKRAGPRGSLDHSQHPAPSTARRAAPGPSRAHPSRSCRFPLRPAPRSPRFLLHQLGWQSEASQGGCCRGP